jgi:hypothetical protein
LGRLISLLETENKIFIKFLNNQIMFRLIIVSSLLLIGVINTTAQTVSDQIRVALTPVVPQNNEVLPESAKSILMNRLRQLSTANGYGGSSFIPQFIIAANPTLLEKKVAGTAPLKIWMELEMTLYIADHLSKTVFATTSITIKGVGSTDTEALMDAYKGFSINKSDIKEFAKNGREEIVKYYNTRCDFIMKQADMLVKSNQANAALDLLLAIPEVSKSCFDEAASKIETIYLTAAEQHCQQLLQAAKSAWANAPNRSGADKASFFLAVIPVQARCKKEVDVLLNEIKTKMLETEQWERKQYNDQIDLMRNYIHALRDIGVAYGEGQPDTQIQVKGWLW